MSEDSSWESANSGLKDYTNTNKIDIVIDARNKLTKDSYNKLVDASAYVTLKDDEMIMFAIDDKAGDLTNELTKSINDTKNTANAISGTKKDLTLFVFKNYIEERKGDSGSETTRYSVLSGVTITYNIIRDSDTTNKATFGKSSATNADEPSKGTVETGKDNFGAIKLTIPQNNNVWEIVVEATYLRTKLNGGQGAKTVGELTVNVVAKSSFGVMLKLTILSFLSIVLIL